MKVWIKAVTIDEEEGRDVCLRSLGGASANPGHSRDVGTEVLATF